MTHSDTRAAVKAVIVEAFEAADYDSPYVYDRDDGTTTLDGRFDLALIADAVIAHFATAFPPFLIVGSGCSQGHGGGGLYGAAMTEEEADAIADRLASEAECDDLLFWVEETPTSPGLIVREDDE